MLSIFIFVNLFFYVLTAKDSCSIDHYDGDDDGQNNDCSSVKIPPEWQKYLENYETANEKSSACEPKDLKFHCVYSDVIDSDLDQFNLIT